MYTIRETKIDDAEAIADLSGQLGYSTNLKETQKRLETILSKNDHCVYVVVKNEKIIGWIHGFCSLRLESNTFTEIGGLVVDENFRGEGIGKMLVLKVTEWTQSKGCNKIRVRCNLIRNETHAFYEHLGFNLKKEQKVFDYSL